MGEKFDYLLDEVHSIWDNLRGRGSSKERQKARLRLPNFLDQEGRITTIWGNGESITGDDLDDRIDDTLAQALWIPATALDFDTAPSPSITKTTGGGGTRLSWLEYPRNTGVAMHSYITLRIPDVYRDTNVRMNTRIWYGISLASAGTATLRSSGFAYDIGDAYTSPTVVWNETLDQNLGLLSINTLYYADLDEATIEIGDYPFVGARITRVSNGATDTYTGSIHIHGVELTVTEAS